MVEKKIIKDAVELTKNIPSTDNNVSENNFDNDTTGVSGDILVPLQSEENELTPYPQIEYMIVEASSMDKVVRDVNTQIQNGWQTEGGIQVVNGPVTKFYQSMIRWNVDAKPEMPSQNSEAECLGTQAALGEGMKFLENEPDLYEDIEKDVDE